MIEHCIANANGTSNVKLGFTELSDYSIDDITKRLGAKPQSLVCIPFLFIYTFA